MSSSFPLAAPALQAGVQPEPSLLERLETLGRDFLPDLLIALGILVVGTLIAYALSAIVRAILNRTSFDERLVGWMRGSGTRPISSEKLISSIVFWLLEAFVIVLALERLDARSISGPIRSALNSVFAFLPNLLVACLILVAAVLIGKGLKALVERAIGAAGLDERLRKLSADDGTSEYEAPTPGAPSLSRSLGKVVYWLVILFAIPLILDVLELEGMLEPVQGMFHQVLAFLPRLFLAAVILFAGYLLAKLLRQIVTNLAQAGGLDRLLERFSGAAPRPGRGPSHLVGHVVFVLVLLPVVVSALHTLEVASLTRPIEDMLDDVLVAIPRLFAAALLLAIAWFVGKLLADLVSRLLQGLGFDEFFRRTVQLASRRAAPAPAPAPQQTAVTVGRTPSAIAGNVLFVFILLLASQEALELLAFDRLALLFQQLLVFLGDVVLGLVIIGIGFWIAGLVHSWVMDSSVSNAPTLALIARVAIIALAITMGLQEMGLGEQVVSLAFSAVLFGAALAMGLAFGLGGREWAQRKLQQLDRP
jgi:hypothetical protein